MDDRYTHVTTVGMSNDGNQDEAAYRKVTSCLQYKIYKNIKYKTVLLLNVSIMFGE